MVEPLNKKRSLGQVFTPEWMVTKILDEIDFTVSNADILTSRVLEPSVGEGVFLQEVVRRVISASRSAGIKDEETAQALSANIVGIDIDDSAVPTCIDRLNEVLAEVSFSEKVDWSIFALDALNYAPEEGFDYVVGNPPYISVHNMPEELRKSVKRFKSSTGTTDIYIIFYELGLKWLRSNGKLGYIAPNSWLKNTSQKSFRKLLIGDQLVSRIIDYGSYPVFGKEASTYTAVAILSENKNNTLSYTKMSGQDSEEFTVSTPYSDIVEYQGAPLVFSSSELLSIKQGIRLQDISTTQNGLCTLRNSVFINPGEVESTVVRPVVKASRYKGEEIIDTILFPYEVNERGIIPMNKLEPMDEERIRDFPEAYEYLISHKDDLLTRDIEKKTLWFHYGRSQGLRNLSKPKLVVSTTISPSAETVKAYEVSAETAVYAGLFVTEKKGSGYSLEDIKCIIESDEFKEHAWAASKDMSGGYKSFSARTVNDFVLPERFIQKSPC